MIRWQVFVIWYPMPGVLCLAPGTCIWCVMPGVRITLLFSLRPPPCCMSVPTGREGTSTENPGRKDLDEMNEADSATIQTFASRTRGRPRGTQLHAYHASCGSSRAQPDVVDEDSHALERARSPRCAPRKSVGDAHWARNKEIQCSTGLNKIQREVTNSKKEHLGFSWYLPTRPKNEFGGCLPVVQYSTV